MTDNQAELKNAEKTTLSIFSGSTRWVIAILVIIGPLLQAIEFLLESGEEETAARVAFWSEFPSRTGLSMASGLLAVPFLLGGVAVIVALTRTHSRRLAWLGGTFMAFGMVGLAAAHGYELAAFGLAQAGNLTGAETILNAESLGLPGAVLLLMFLGGAFLGTLTMAAAIWRSPYVPRIVVLFLLAFAVLDFAVGQGVLSHLVNLVGFTILAVAILTGYSRSSHRTATPAMQARL
jgi:GNAT superfamily N-acetyltransferase